MRMSLRRLTPLSSLLCEWLGLFALFLVPEVERPLFLAPLLMGVLAGLAHFRLRDRYLLPLVAILVAAGYATAIGQPTGTILVRALIPAHAVLWLAADEGTYRYWRLGIALIELVLAAILSPEVHMFVLIFFFVVTSSLAMALGFLERNFRVRDVDALERPLRASFVISVLALSCLTFLSSLAIFPVLPHAHWSEAAETSVGYNDVVSFREGILSWAKGDSRPLLWIFRGPGQAWESVLPYFLLRGEALERFDGEEWRKSPRPTVPNRIPVQGKIEPIEILRQPMSSDALPVPYGALKVTSLEPGHPQVANYGESGWILPGSREHSVKYGVDTGDFAVGALGGPPDPATRKLNEQAFAATARLARRLKEGTKSDEERILRVKRYFIENDFRYELAPMPAMGQGAHPVERFLFEQKRGHCELFASATALLFRGMGMPARLVAGFRVRPPSRGDVTTVRSSEAHAWVEVWTSGRGWTPVDTSPVVFESNGWAWSVLNDVYDLVGAYWHRYILEYEFDGTALRGLLPSKPLALWALLLFAALGLAWKAKIPERPGPRERLAGIRASFEDDLLHRAGVYPNVAWRDFDEVREWDRQYQQLRFGRETPTPEQLAHMRKVAKDMVAKLARATGAAG